MKKIKCPVCEAEYLPAEIFYPTDIIGNPTRIDKDPYGKIVFYKDTEQALSQTFVCDKCNNKFKVDAFIKFDVSEIKPEFSKTYHTTHFTKPSLSMDEL